ncbi:MAG TPA: trimeric intracellular cation channel family protein, partial [Geobacter sulfurreducens]|nr:trimeric intracellular cation channel family protein [Geobacter sulfurreducens]
GAPEQVQLFTCLAVTLVLRLLAMRFGLSLPRIKGLAPAPGDGGTGDGKE